MSDNKTNWWLIVAIAIIVAVVASLVTIKMTGNVIRVNQDMLGKNTVYTQAEVDAIIAKNVMPRYNGCVSISVENGTGDSACAIEKKICKLGLKVWSRHNESDFGTEGPVTDIIPAVSDCSTNWGVAEGQDQVISYLCC